MHPSSPGWKACEFRFKNQVRRSFLLASHGLPINVELPTGFPVKGPVAALNWAITANPGNPPNVVLFIGALLGLNSMF
jgi:hypothetical protein